MGNGFLLPADQRVPTPVYKLSAADFELDESSREKSDWYRSFNCAICQGSIGWDILQTPCHHRFCSRCILEWLEVSKSCPFCKAQVSKENLTRLGSEDQQLLGDVGVRCARRDGSGVACGQVLRYRDLTEHADTCPHVQLRCHFSCKRTYLRKEQEAHVRTCSHRPVPCKECGQPVPLRKMQQHLEKCHMQLTLACSACPFQALDAQGLAVHLRRECPQGELVMQVLPLRSQTRLIWHRVMPSGFDANFDVNPCCVADSRKHCMFDLNRDWSTQTSRNLSCRHKQGTQNISHTRNTHIHSPTHTQQTHSARRAVAAGDRVPLRWVFWRPRTQMRRDLLQRRDTQISERPDTWHSL